MTSTTDELDEVVLLGEQGGVGQPTDAITAEDIAQLTDTIPYEVLCDIDARVPRIMVD